MDRPHDDPDTSVKIEPFDNGGWLAEYRRVTNAEINRRLDEARRKVAEERTWALRR